MRKALIIVGFLSACGVDGAPVPPAAPGITISGTVSAGLATDSR